MNAAEYFGLISSIAPVNEQTWQDKIFLTFDHEWVVDEILDDTLKICGSYGAAFTVYATHRSDLLKSYARNHKNIEIGIHPNFNKLLTGEEKYTKGYRTVVEELLGFYPSVKSVRAHSLTFGSLIQTAYTDYGLTHDSSLLIPFQRNINELFPFTLWDDLIRVPHLFCDYTTAMLSDKNEEGRESDEIDNMLNRRGLKVLDFHPIHVFLNTESLERYEQTRPIHRNPKELIKHRFQGYGTRDRLLDVLNSNVTP